MYEVILKRDPEARLELVEAYTRLFTGHGGAKDAQIVFADIIAFSDYFNVCVDGSLERHEGRRMVGGRIFSMVNLPEGERTALFQAARESALADQANGGEI